MNQKLSIMLYVVVLSGLSSQLYAEEAMRCNGYTEFCSRRYNEIAYINSHNAVANKPCPVQDQDKSLVDQFNDGIRVMKIPIHHDYSNPVGYYYDLFKTYSDDLNKRMNNLQKKIDRAQNDNKFAYEIVKKKVDGMQKTINEKEQQIQDKKYWYDHLPLDKRVLNAFKQGFDLLVLEVDKGTLIAAQKILYLDLQAVEKIIDAFIPLNYPEFIPLSSEKVMVDLTLKALQKEGEQAREWKPFVCHAVPKKELYKDYLGDLINKAPDNIQAFLRVILKPLQSALHNLIETAFGNADDPGRLFPYTPCLLDNGRTPLINVLQNVKFFLATHPHEVFTLLVEDHIENHQELTNIFTQAGLIPYAHSQDPNKLWPTLQEMIISGKRLVIFVTTSVDSATYPWFNSEGPYKWLPTRGTFSNVEELQRVTIENELGVPLGAQTIEQDPKNKILIISHTITNGFTGNKTSATAINSRAIFRNRMKNMCTALNRIVNFISVDFYEHPNNDVFDVVDEINGVGKYAGKPLWKKSDAS